MKYKVDSLNTMKIKRRKIKGHLPLSINIFKRCLKIKHKEIREQTNMLSYFFEKYYEAKSSMILHKKDLERTTSVFLDLIRIDLLQKKIRVCVNYF